MHAAAGVDCVVSLTNISHAARAQANKNNLVEIFSFILVNFV
jgi:hypothetical protein